MLETGHDRHVLAIVAVEEYHPRHVGPSLELFTQQCRRSVHRAIVDEQYLVGNGELVQCRIEPGEQRSQPGFLVIDRDDDGDLRRRGVGHCEYSRNLFLLGGRLARLLDGGQLLAQSAD